MQFLDVDAMIKCLCNVWVLMQYSDVDANVQLFMQCLGVYAMFGCGWIVMVLM